MTQAPERERVVAPDTVREAGPDHQAPRQLLDKTAWSKAVMVLNVALIGAVAIIGLTYVRNAEEPAAEAAPQQPSGIASTLASPDDELSDPPVADAPAAQPAVETPVAPSGGVAVAEAPKAPVSMRSDFSAGDAWPVGAGFRESGSMAWPLGVVDRVMTHGAPSGSDAVSWLEKWMRTDVRTLGAQVLFAPNHSGVAAMTAWHTSILDLPGQQTPRTGMRLVMAPGEWRLVTLDGAGPTTIATGSWVQQGRSASFTLVRKADTVWVTAPDGLTTAVTDPLVASLSGPWASWELREAGTGKRPAGFQSIWAG